MPELQDTSVAPGAPPNGATATPNGAVAAVAAAQPWFGDLSADPELKGWAELKKFPDPIAALKHGYGAEKLLGVPKDDLIRKPRADASIAERQAYHRAIGVPETPEGYKLEVPQGVEDLYAKRLAPILHKNNISGDVEGLSKDFNALNVAMSEEAENQKAAAMQAEIIKIKQEWGEKAYDEKIAMGDKVIRGFGLEAGFTEEELVPMLAEIKQMPAWGYKKLIQMFSTIGKKLGEPSWVDGNSASSSKNFAVTKQEAMVKKAQLMSDPAFAAGYQRGKDSAEWAQIQDLNAIILG